MKRSRLSKGVHRKRSRLDVCSVYPEEMTIGESEVCGKNKGFDDLRKALSYVKKNGGQIYTQVDSESGDRVYLRGNHFVNRTGQWLVVKLAGGSSLPVTFKGMGKLVKD